MSIYECIRHRCVLFWQMKIENTNTLLILNEKSVAEKPVDYLSLIQLWQGGKSNAGLIKCSYEHVINLHNFCVLLKKKTNLKTKNIQHNYLAYEFARNV